MQFSEDCYAAGWLDCTEDTAGEFEAYLSSLRRSSEHYEYRALPLLREVAMEAGFVEEDSAGTSALARMLFGGARPEDAQLRLVDRNDRGEQRWLTRVE